MMPTDFDALQASIQATSGPRLAEQRACEAFLNALYHALRHASGPGLPLNNVSIEPAEDRTVRLRPLPQGSWHAAWFRLGLCEVYVRVQRQAGQFVGEYGQQGRFRQSGISEDDLLALARSLMRALAQELGDSGASRTVTN
ncbi:hypothetical protein [Deinococcus sonorensis]|uniref:Uncharacterized protein n=2 Tax=Deinococcus sonorensis TaxID=309891 RepID=A0AAU7UAD6_9DEIO